MKKEGEFNIAINLRRQGLSYSEIRKQVSVAKSTLSLWFHEVGLAEHQKQRITEKRIAGALRGAMQRKSDRIERSELIRQQSIAAVGELTQREFWLLGAMLYWAEGSKQKVHAVSAGVIFCNSDPAMIALFNKWLLRICKVASDDIYFEIYIHETASAKAARIFWADILRLPHDYPFKVYFKKGNISSYRKNKGEQYHGLIRICVRCSSELNRKIMGWVEGVCQKIHYSGIV